MSGLHAGLFSSDATLAILATVSIFGSEEIHHAEDAVGEAVNEDARHSEART